MVKKKGTKKGKKPKKKPKKVALKIDSISIPLSIPTIIVSGSLSGIDEAGNFLTILILTSRPFYSEAKKKMVIGNIAQTELFFDLKTLKSFTKGLQERISRMEKIKKKEEKK